MAAYNVEKIKELLEDHCYFDDDRMEETFMIPHTNKRKVFAYIEMIYFDHWGNVEVDLMFWYEGDNNRHKNLENEDWEFHHQSNQLSNFRSFNYRGNLSEAIYEFFAESLEYLVQNNVIKKHPTPDQLKEFTDAIQYRFMLEKRWATVDEVIKYEPK